MASVKVKFRPSSITRKEGTIYYQLIHRCKVKHIRTAYKLFPNEWDSPTGIVIASAGEDEDRKRYLATLKQSIEKDLQRIKKCICRLEQENKPFTVERVLEFCSRSEEGHTFLSYGMELTKDLKGIGKVRTAETYRSALNSFQRFWDNRADLPLEDVTSHTMVAYENWLKGGGICPNTTSYYMRNLRAIYNRAVEQGLISQQHPFRHVYTGIEKTRKRAVSLEVIRKIRNMELKQKQLAFARDLFMFSFYTRGMSFVDMVFLKKKDLQNGILSYRRNKTGQQLFIKWEKPMQELVEKYDTAGTPYLLPIIRNNGVDEWRQYHNEVHRINRNLKKIGEQIGLGIPLTTYVARHAWASIAKSKNIALSVISEALGHDSEQTTRIYLASLDTSVIDKANSLILMAIK